LTDWYQQNSPFARLQKETTDVSIESIVQQSPKSYEVVWTESIHDLYGQLQGTHRYRAIVTVNTQEVTDPKQALINPLGLYVTNVSWGEVVSSGATNGTVQSTDGGQTR
jgi:type IV secretion system protein VirB5